ncbi:MAG: ABC transporter ATP-binding protein, partial [Anaerolineales bacterium]|nr:ABC transporter ATP-binding protein [Anaerolineales bacterium]
DEPTNHLDLKYQVNLLKLVKKLVRQEGLSVLMAMHDLNQVSGTADRVALLANGQLKAIGSPEEVLTQENILQAYQIEIDTFTHPKTNKHMIFPTE